MSDLHTKYRPKSLKEVVGQGAIVKSLRNVIKKKRTHAFTFAGPSGVGKTTLARIVAREIGVARENIAEIDAASHTGVDDMRALMDGTKYRALGDNPLKAYIIDECHRLSGAAWDSLLKLLEEPPDHVYWFLCTTEPGKIKKTIGSRTVAYALKSVPTDEIADILVHIKVAEKMEIDEDVLDLCARSADGSVRQAITYMAACEGITDRREAKAAIQQSTEGRTVIDLCRYLLYPQPRTWAAAQKVLMPLREEPAESTRIVVLNYFNAILAPKDPKKQKKPPNDKTVFRVLALMDCFIDPFPQQNGFAALSHAVGKALFGYGK